MSTYLSHEQIARVCHEANRAYCMTLEDHSHPTWDMAPEWQKESAINGVKSLVLDPSKSAAQSHREWMRWKEDRGWKYGPRKIPEQLLHPCMLPWEELPIDQRLKDELFRAIVRVLLPLIPGRHIPVPSPLGPEDDTPTAMASDQVLEQVAAPAAEAVSVPVIQDPGLTVSSVVSEDKPVETIPRPKRRRSKQQ